jgi:hypothetical protein
MIFEKDPNGKVPNVPVVHACFVYLEVSIQCFTDMFFRRWKPRESCGAFHAMCTFAQILMAKVRFAHNTCGAKAGAHQDCKETEELAVEPGQTRIEHGPTSRSGHRHPGM